MSIINTQAVANAKKVLTGKTAHCTMQGQTAGHYGNIPGTGKRNKYQVPAAGRPAGT